MKIQYEPKFRKSFEKKSQIKINENFSNKEFVGRSNSLKIGNSKPYNQNKEIRFMKNKNDGRTSFGKFYHQYFNPSNSQKKKNAYYNKETPFFVGSEAGSLKQLNQKRRSLADLKNQNGMKMGKAKLLRNSLNKHSNAGKNFDSLNGKLIFFKNNK